MLRILIYMVGGLLAAFILAFVWVSLRSTKSQGDRGSGSPIFFCLLLVWGGPFFYVELLTKAKGQLMKSAVSEAFYSVEPNATMVYFKVLSCHDNAATALAVGKSQDEYGFADRPLVLVRLGRSSSGWEATEVRVAVSDRHGVSEMVMPPYR